MRVWGIDADTFKIVAARARPAPTWNIIEAKGKRADDRFPKLVQIWEAWAAAHISPHDYVYVEKPIYTGNPNSTIVQSYLIGALLSTLIRLGIANSLVDNTVWKKALLGGGGANKDKIRAWIVARFNLADDLLQDVYDAVAIAEWGAQRLGKES